MEKESPKGNIEILKQFPVSNYLSGIPIPNQHCTFSNFDFMDQSDILSERLVAFVNGTLDKHGMIFWGTFGVGKTHIAIALYRVMVCKLDGISDIHFSTLSDLLSEVSGDDDYLNYVCGYEYLFLDDIASRRNYTVTELDVIRKILLNRHEKAKFLVVTSNLPPDQLDQIGLFPHTISRLYEMCYSMRIVGGDRRHANY